MYESSFLHKYIQTHLFLVMLHDSERERHLDYIQIHLIQMDMLHFLDNYVIHHHQ
jgi:hypothetical protein